MRIGIVVTATTASGGIYQYTKSMIAALYQSPTMLCTFFVLPECEIDLSGFSRPGWSLVVMDPEVVLTTKPPTGSLDEALNSTILYGCNREAHQFFSRHTVDLLLYPSPWFLCFECGIPYVMAVHDLQHRLHPEFPEVSSDGEWGRREYLYRNGIKFAKGILVDSEVGREDLLNCYADVAVSGSVHVLPFASAIARDGNRAAGLSFSTLQAKYGLHDTYFFYPAQFWAHKNHARLIRALSLLRKSSACNLQLVLVGSHHGAPHERRQQVFDEMWSLAYELDVADMLLYLGYVPDEELQLLYQHAQALVMATFFGPTNIPVLEAWEAGCPVITSDIRGIREQVGPAAVLVNPVDEASIAQAMSAVLSDESLRRTLVEKGRTQLAECTMERFTDRLLTILDHIAEEPDGLSLASSCRQGQSVTKSVISSAGQGFPRLTVVTPSFNQGGFLERCIDSILSQNYPNLEYIIMDGGSSDGSVEIVKKYERYLTYWQSRPDGGHYWAVNQGLQQATGEIMTWLNSDDQLNGGALHTAGDIFSSMPCVDWITGRPRVIDAEGAELWTLDSLPIWSWHKYLQKQFHSPYIQQEGTFWRRELWHKAGGYVATYLEFAGDLELWARFFRHAELYTANVVLASYRQHPGQKMATYLERYNREAEGVLEREIQRILATGTLPAISVPLPILLAGNERPSAVNYAGETGGRQRSMTSENRQGSGCTSE